MEGRVSKELIDKSMEEQFVDEDDQHVECSENTSGDDDQYSDGELKDD